MKLLILLLLITETNLLFASKENRVPSSDNSIWTCMAECGYGRFVRDPRVPAYTMVVGASIIKSGKSLQETVTNLINACKETSYKSINENYSKHFGELGTITDRPVTKTQLYKDFDITNLRDPKTPDIVKFIPVELSNICSKE